MSVQPHRRRFTVDEYYAMGAAGIFTEDDRIELIEGEIIEMAAIGSHHAACVHRLNRMLVQQTGERAVVLVQNPVRLSDLTEPQPDLALLRPRDDFYASGHPGPRDVLLLIEVAHSSPGYDRGTKLPLYALAGVPEVWIVDIDGGVIEVYRTPDHDRYVTEDRGVRGDTISPGLMPSVVVPVSGVLD